MDFKTSHALRMISILYRILDPHAPLVKMGFGSYFVLVVLSLSLALADYAAITDARRSTNETADHCCVKVDTASRQIIDATGRYKYS